MCKTGMSDDTGQARALLLDQLMQTRRRQAVLTYRQLLDALPLRVPKMQQLARLLEQLAEQDAQRGWPLRSALVVSQTGSSLPRQGFFSTMRSRHSGHARQRSRCKTLAHPGAAADIYL